jgi:hypothetical protein
MEGPKAEGLAAPLLYPGHSVGTNCLVDNEAIMCLESCLGQSTSVWSKVQKTKFPAERRGAALRSWFKVCPDVVQRWDCSSGSLLNRLVISSFFGILKGRIMSLQIRC